MQVVSEVGFNIVKVTQPRTINDRCKAEASSQNNTSKSGFCFHYFTKLNGMIQNSFSVGCTKIVAFSKIVVKVAFDNSCF